MPRALVVEIEMSTDFMRTKFGFPDHQGGGGLPVRWGLTTQPSFVDISTSCALGCSKARRRAKRDRKTHDRNAYTCVTLSQATFTHFSSLAAVCNAKCGDGAPLEHVESFWVPSGQPSGTFLPCFSWSSLLDSHTEADAQKGVPSSEPFGALLSFGRFCCRRQKALFPLFFVVSSFLDKDTEACARKGVPSGEPFGTLLSFFVRRKKEVGSQLALRKLFVWCQMVSTWHFSFVCPLFCVSWRKTGRPTPERGC